MTLVKVDTRRITNWDTFHKVFAETFGFPDFYGHNMNAWIDCMTCLDDPDAKMTSVHAEPGGVVVIELEHFDDFALRCPDLYAAVVECSAFVNWRRIDTGQPAVLALSFYKRNTD
jgi:Barstar (barnase inhibitor)